MRGTIILCFQIISFTLASNLPGKGIEMASEDEKESVTALHEFGGEWTQQKLRILDSYLRAYMQVMKNQRERFRIAYIDAFAGSRYRVQTASDDTETLLFPDLAEDAPQRFLDGSVIIALRVEPNFDRYIFIEKVREKYQDLLRLTGDFPKLADRIEIRRGDANSEIQQLCKRNWTRHRAVLFLDPFGMQTRWETIRAIAGTKAIDLWVLWPLGMGLHRLLTRSGKIPDAWRRRLDTMLGANDWYDEFYRVQAAPSLLDPEEKVLVKAKTAVLAKYLNQRLKQTFAGVAPNPKVLFNSRGNPLYLLCFAVSNPSPKARAAAIDIAKHILDMDD